MNETKNIKECKKLISNLENKQYFSAAVKVYKDKHSHIVNNLIANGINNELALKHAYKLILSHLHDIIREAEPFVEDVITNRIKKGESKDASQARKSVAGNLFQQFIVYSITQNIIIKNIDKNIVAILQSKKHHQKKQKYCRTLSMILMHIFDLNAMSSV